jgi:hypothetical protein
MRLPVNLREGMSVVPRVNLALHTHFPLRTATTMLPTTKMKIALES